MKYLTVSNINIAQLRGSSINKHDMLPVLAGVKTLETNIGNFTNESAYEGDSFTTKPNESASYWLIAKTNTGKFYYLPLSSVIFSYKFNVVESYKLFSSEGSNTVNKVPYYSVTAQAVFAIQPFEESLIITDILSCSILALYDVTGRIEINEIWDGLKVTTVLSTSIPSVTTTECQAISISLVLPNTYPANATQDLTTLAQCIPVYSSESPEFKTYNRNLEDYAFLVNNTKTIKFSVVLEDPKVILDYYQFGEYYLDSEFSFNYYDSEPQIVELQFKSLKTIHRHLI